MNDACRRVAEQAAGFVLGALEPDEERAVREHLATCPEGHPEFEELGGVVPYLAEAVPVVEPPAFLRERIRAAAAADLAARAAAPVAVEMSSVRVTPIDTAAIHGAPPRRRPWFAWAGAVAAVLALLVVGGWNLALQRDLEAARLYQAGLSAVLDVAAAPGSGTAILTATGAAGPSGLAAVSADGRVAIVMRDLVPTTGREVYEAWIIGGDGKPVPIGGFTVGPTGAATFTVAGVGAQPDVTLALTREPAPGATTPTLPIVSAGQAVAPGS